MTDESKAGRTFFELSSEALGLLGVTHPPEEDGTIALRMEGGITLMVLPRDAGDTVVVLAECPTVDAGTGWRGLLVRNFAAVAEGGPILAVNPSNERCVALCALDGASAEPRDLAAAIGSVLETALALEDEAARPAADDAPSGVDEVPDDVGIDRLA
jgi:hypothetical protein